MGADLCLSGTFYTTESGNSDKVYVLQHGRHTHLLIHTCLGIPYGMANVEVLTLTQTLDDSIHWFSCGI